MIVSTQDGTARLDQADDLKGFKLAPGSGQGVDDVTQALARAAAGRVTDGFAWIDAGWIRREAGTRDAAWQEGFEAMIGFARSKGWCDESSGAIRAHIAWEDGAQD